MPASASILPLPKWLAWGPLFTHSSRMAVCAMMSLMSVSVKLKSHSLATCIHRARMPATVGVAIEVPDMAS